jgi:hypothetical protein
MEAFAAWLGTFLSPILTPIIKGALREVIDELAENRAVVGKPNADLQRLWESNSNSAGNGDANIPQG